MLNLIVCESEEELCELTGVDKNEVPGTSEYSLNICEYSRTHCGAFSFKLK